MSLEVKRSQRRVTLIFQFIDQNEHTSPLLRGIKKTSDSQVKWEMLNDNKTLTPLGKNLFERSHVPYRVLFDAPFSLQR